MTGTPVIPSEITVHLGRPDAPARNVTVSFPDYIKNVASSEIYPTWPENALRANIYAQVTFALNRIYTEWYRSRGYDFDITNSTQFDQYYVQGREIFENVSRIVDELFNDYIRRQGNIEPLFSQFCNGTTVTCDGLSQWGSVELAKQGRTPYEILRTYYGSDIDLVFNAPVRDVPESYGGVPLRKGAVGPDVRTIQVKLNRISANYPAIPKIYPVDAIFGNSTEAAVKKFQEIFSLTPDGIVGKETWYRIVYLYVSVKNLAELYSEGISLSEFSFQPQSVLRLGSSGTGVRILQYILALAAKYDQSLLPVAIDGTFGPATQAAVVAFQREYGLSPDGVVGEATWDKLARVYTGIIDTPFFQSGEIPVLAYPGVPLQEGMSGQSVTDLQEYLSLVATVFTAIPQVQITGYFGEDTKNAVKVFQSEFDLLSDGIVGETTWNRLTSVYDDILNGSKRTAGQYPGYLLREG